MLNLFNHEEATNDFTYIMNEVGSQVLINGQSTQALITNTKLNIHVDYDDRYISTTTELERGQIVHYNNGKWIVLTETEAPRHHKYKAIMRHLTHTFEILIGEVEGEIIDYDRFGRPIYGESTPIYLEVNAFAEQRKIMATTGAIRVVEGEILFTISDNEENRQLEMNNTLSFGGSNYRIYAIDQTQKGLLILNCEKVI